MTWRILYSQAQAGKELQHHNRSFALFHEHTKAQRHMQDLWRYDMHDNRGTWKLARKCLDLGEMCPLFFTWHSALVSMRLKATHVSKKTCDTQMMSNRYNLCFGVLGTVRQACRFQLQMIAFNIPSWRHFPQGHFNHGPALSSLSACICSP